MTKEVIKLALEVFGGCNWHDEIVDGDWADKAQSAIKALEKALKQEQGEPVGEVSEHDWSTGLLYRDLEPGTPLYTTPQYRKPLTDEQKTKIARMFSDRVANECNINAEDHWKLHSVSVLDDINFILQAIQEIKE